MDELDDVLLRELGERSCTELLLSTGSDIDAALGAAVLRRLGHDFLLAAPPAELPDGITLRIVPPQGPVPELRVFAGSGPSTGRTILWIHGGGLIAGLPLQDDLLCAQLAIRHGCTVVATAYRLAPEHPYPAALEDCTAALLMVLSSPEELGIQSEIVLLAGASAGGGLAVATALLARDRGMPSVDGLVLYYPMLDDRPGRASMDRIVCQKLWHRDLDRLAWQSYLGADRTAVPLHAAPARAGAAALRGLPPTFVDVGSLDGFLDECLAFAADLARAQVAVELVVTPGAFHGSENLDPQAPSSARIIAARTRAFETMFMTAERSHRP